MLHRSNLMGLTWDYRPIEHLVKVVDGSLIELSSLQLRVVYAKLCD